MRKNVLILLFLFFPVFIFSQQAVPHPVSIRANLLGPLDILDGNVTGGVEYRLGRRLALTADLGAIFYSVYIDNYLSLGYVFKPGLRYYFTDARRGYISGDFFYKRVGYKINDWLEKGVVNNVAAYEEFQKFVYQKQVFGFQLLAGYKGKLNKKATVWLEPYGGFSIRTKWQNIKGMPDARYTRTTVLTDGLDDEFNLFPGVQFGLRLVMDLVGKPE